MVKSATNSWCVFPRYHQNRLLVNIGPIHKSTRLRPENPKSFIQNPHAKPASLRHRSCAVTTTTCPAKQYAKNHGLHSKVHDVIMVNIGKLFLDLLGKGGALSPNWPLNAIDGDIPKLGQVSPYKFRLDTAPPSPSNDSDQADFGTFGLTLMSFKRGTCVKIVELKVFEIM